MTIQFNTDKNTKVGEAESEPMAEQIQSGLKRFSEWITRIEVHLSDENGKKNGINDKRCLLEARLKGLQPIVVKDQASTHSQALSGALTKLNALLDSTLGRLNNKN